MKGIVVYDTTYGNTKQIAETIAETLKGSGIEVDTYCLARSNRCAIVRVIEAKV